MLPFMQHFVVRADVTREMLYFMQDFEPRQRSQDFHRQLLLKSGTAAATRPHHMKNPASHQGPRGFCNSISAVYFTLN